MIPLFQFSKQKKYVIFRTEASLHFSIQESLNFHRTKVTPISEYKNLSTFTVKYSFILQSIMVHFQIRKSLHLQRKVSLYFQGRTITPSSEQKVNFQYKRFTQSSKYKSRFSGQKIASSSEQKEHSIFREESFYFQERQLLCLPGKKNSIICLKLEAAGFSETLVFIKVHSVTFRTTDVLIFTQNLQKKFVGRKQCRILGFCQTHYVSIRIHIRNCNWLIMSITRFRLMAND